MENKNAQLLNKNWQFKNTIDEKWYDAIVPGCVHLDLLENKLIPNPFVRNNEKKLQWIAEENWTYRLHFVPEKEILRNKNKVIFFEGLDTYADIFLNGIKILSSNNMFHPWEKEISEILKNGVNELEVCFRSPTKEVSAQMRQLTYQLPADNDQAGKTSPFTRKAPYHYGWDWGPCFVTSGIWRNVSLIGWSDWHVKRSSITNCELESSIAHLLFELEIVSEADEEVSIVIEEPKAQITIESSINLKNGNNFFREKFSIANPKLWWPAGHGEPFLYNFNITIQTSKNQIKIPIKTGIRDVYVERKEDKVGKSFEIHVNGKPIFAKGANWIPADSFTTRLNKNDYASLIASARDANMNMLRVWGGGIYEPDVFYELCDEMGIMVWQDFMFACSMYPAHPEFLESVKVEAEYQVNRLKTHPSIVLWCGNNEIAIAWHGWGWKEELPSSVWEDYAKIFHEVLPEVCINSDSKRLYWPSSPGYTTKLPKNNQIYGSGDNHYWGVWHGGDGFDAFEKNIGRFLSEYGMQSFPEMATIMKFADKEDLDINSEVMLARQKASLGTGNLIKYIKDYLTMQSDFAALVVSSQITQALAIKTAVETHRRSMPFCMGTLYWQFNDCWPAISWSSLDYYGNWKALHYHAKRFFKPIIILIHEKEEKVFFSLVNDQHQKVKLSIHILVSTFDGSILLQRTIDDLVSKFSSKEVFSFKKKEYFEDQNNSDLFINAEIIKDEKSICSNNHFFVNPKDLSLPPAKFNYKVQAEDEKVSIQIKASSFIYQLYITCNNSEGIFSDNYFDLLPGQEVIIVFMPKEECIDFNYDFSIKTAMDLIMMGDL